jgi:hypothetical protein
MIISGGFFACIYLAVVVGLFRCIELIRVAGRIAKDLMEKAVEADQSACAGILMVSLSTGQSALPAMWTASHGRAVFPQADVFKSSRWDAGLASCQNSKSALPDHPPNDRGRPGAPEIPALMLFSLPAWGKHVGFFSRMRNVFS